MITFLAWLTRASEQWLPATLLWAVHGFLATEVVMHPSVIDLLVGQVNSDLLWGAGRVAEKEACNGYSEYYLTTRDGSFFHFDGMDSYTCSVLHTSNPDVRPAGRIHLSGTRFHLLRTNGGRI